MGTQSTLPWGVAVVLVIAYALFSGGGPAPQPAQAAPAPVQAAAQAEPAGFSMPANPKEEGAFACLDVPPPLRPICRQLTRARSVSGELNPGQPAPQAAQPASPGTAPMPWIERPWVQRAQSGVKVVIALVPDPELTRLSLYYGRTIDSIILAGGRLNYLFDSYWMPWKAAGSRAAADTAKGDPPLVPGGLDPPATLPGALLFRHSTASWEPAGATTTPAYLLVLLVGESNVSGLRRDQFTEALYYRGLLNADSKQVPILGPTYSGTFASLHKSLREDLPAHPGSQYRIVTGNTTVKGAREKMRHSTVPITLTAVQRDDESTLNSLLHRVDAPRLGQIAMLSEGVTAFGATPIRQWDEPTGGEGKVQHTTRILQIPFPRGIAQLRDVYPEDAPPKAAPGSSAEAAEQLPLSLHGGPAGSDTPELFNMKHLTVAQEAQMQALSGILNRGSIETAFVFASDVLDLTFVTGYLRQSCPNLRIIVQDWDLLFLQTTSKWSLDGVWVLTSLLPPPLNVYAPERPNMRRPEDWTPLLVSSQFEHALYDSAYTLFEETLLGFDESSRRAAADPHIRSRVTTENHEAQEPIWLSVVGHKAIWPMGELSGMKPVLNKANPGQARFSGRITKLTALLIWTVLGLAALYQLLIIYSILYRWLPRGVAGLAPPRPRGIFSWWDPGFEGRVGYHSLGVLILGCMAHVLTAPFANWQIEHMPIGDLQPAGQALCFSALVLAVLGLARTMSSNQPAGRKLEKAVRVIPMQGGLFAAIVVTIILLWSWQDLLGGTPSLRAQFVTLRSMDVFSGVSPTLPLLLLACGYLTLAWTHMRRHEIYMRVRPDIPRVLPRINAAFVASDPASETKWVACFVAAVYLIAGMLFHFFRNQSFEGPDLQGDLFDHLYLGGLAILWAALITAVFRLFYLWSPLHLALRVLERAPLRRAFTALPTEFANSPLVPSAKRQDHRVMLTRSLDTLRAFANQTPSQPTAARIQRRLPYLTKLVEYYLLHHAAGHPDSARCFRRIQRRMVFCCSVIAAYLQPNWQTGMSASQCSTAGLASDICLAEEFLALRYLAVIRYSVSQMWSQIWFLVLGFFFAVLSTTAYPFRSQGSIRWMTNFFLCALGLPVLYIVFAAERSPILKRLSSNPEGKQGAQILPMLTRLAVLGALPLLSVINSYVPLLGRLLSTWVEPLATMSK